MDNGKNHKWIYTYAYAPEQTWEPWRTEASPASWIDGACTAVRERAAGLIGADTLKLALLTDTHYVINGTWEDTAHSLLRMHELIAFDAVLHLGDLTDGMLPAEGTRAFEKIVKDDMNALGVPVHIVPGNHDYNYFRGNPAWIYPETPRFCVDFDARRLRLICIDSFDPAERLRYGFTDACIRWLESALHGMPAGFSAIVFSHVTPLVRLQAWAADIRGRVDLMAVLDRYADGILAFVNGHNHCDLLFNDLYNGKFPIVSVNASKCECFYEHKPEGGVTPHRRLGDGTQECWDVLLADGARRRLDFVRFGAGRDRVVRNGKAEWI